MADAAMDANLKAALARFSERGGVLFGPANESDIAAANRELAAHDCPLLPLDYAALLMQANGGACFGFMLYPVLALEENGTSMTQATVKERKAGFYDRCHIIGQGYNSFIPLLRDFATGEYRWHDEDGSLLSRHETIEGMLEEISTFGHRPR